MWNEHCSIINIRTLQSYNLQHGILLHAKIDLAKTLSPKHNLSSSSLEKLLQSSNKLNFISFKSSIKGSHFRCIFYHSKCRKESTNLGTKSNNNLTTLVIPNHNNSLTYTTLQILPSLLPKKSQADSHIHSLSTAKALVNCGL